MPCSLLRWPPHFQDFYSPCLRQHSWEKLLPNPSQLCVDDTEYSIPVKLGRHFLASSMFKQYTEWGEKNKVISCPQGPYDVIRSFQAGYRISRSHSVIHPTHLLNNLLCVRGWATKMAMMWLVPPVPYLTLYAIEKWG